MSSSVLIKDKQREPPELHSSNRDCICKNSGTIIVGIYVVLIKGVVAYSLNFGQFKAIIDVATTLLQCNVLP